MRNTIFKYEKDRHTDYIVFNNLYESYSIISSTRYSGFPTMDKCEETGKTIDDVIQFLKEV